ncbi:hypothetical protein BDZ89DRAFT_1040153 [Hymenopellis radicata]|nr:hypothetical protein BDZ89DRAFT_1040153 [Hymenopellis radicata]
MTVPFDAGFTQPELLSASAPLYAPFCHCDDAMLNEVLRSSGLSALQEGMKESEGGNLSTGQRSSHQAGRLHALLILDEATSHEASQHYSMYQHRLADYRTDAIIQASLRSGVDIDIGHYAAHCRA